MNGGALIGSTVVTASAFTAKVVADGLIAQTDADPASMVTQVGVFGVVIAVAYYFLRRGDTREQQLTQSAEAELKVVRNEAAVLRAEIHEMQNKMIQVLAESLKMKDRLAQLEVETTLLKSSGH